MIVWANGYTPPPLPLTEAFREQRCKDCEFQRATISPVLLRCRENARKFVKPDEKACGRFGRKLPENFR